MNSKSASNDVLKSLLNLKVAALLHDPPHKMWVIRSKRSHYEEARKFAKQIVKDTALERYIDEYFEESVLQKLVSTVDDIAASFDRWPLMVEGRVMGFLWYDRIHNIFDPRKWQSLTIPPEIDVLSEADEVAGKVNSYLKYVEERASRNLPERKLMVTLYNTLYLILEPQWYLQRLPPSLADTRAPTHTIFDHNYAAASVSNIVYGGELRGYYVIIDFPGIQKFIAGRKAGDLWISSWILSNVIWSIGYSIAEEWGLDSILTPTPRLNPYAFKGLISTITNEPLYTVKCAGDVPQEICNFVSKMYGFNIEGSLNQVEELWSQPIVPALITLILPHAYAESPKEVVERLFDSFRWTWRSLYDSVVKRLLSGGGKLDKFFLKYLQDSASIISEPPQGLSIAVVSLDKVYGDLEKCIMSGDEETCGKLGLPIDKENQEKISAWRDIPRKLLYHLVVTRGTELAKKYGVLVSAVPRALWYYSKGTGRLESVGGLDNERTCTICGEEPSILRLEKVFRSEVRGVEDDYSNKAWDDIRRIVGCELNDEDKRVFRVYLRPGEVLGPYCLFKRAAYHAFRDVFRPLSTDDVALKRLSHMFSKNYKELFNELSKTFRVEPELCTMPVFQENPQKLLDALLKDREVKSIEELAFACGKTFSEFVSALSRSIEKACVEGLRNKPVLLAKYAAELLGVKWDELGVLAELLSKAAVSSTSIFKKLCNTLIPQTSYAIVRGDADYVGIILSGQLPPNLDLDLRRYIEALLNSLNEHSKVIGAKEVLEDVNRGYRGIVELAEALKLKGALVSPAWHSAVSLSLMLSAIDDYRYVNNFWDGMLIYSGGDDVLALLPVHTAIAAAQDLRIGFTGEFFKKVGGVIATSSMVTGRSFSIRFVNLKDLMNQEIVEAIELLESLAKRALWEAVHGQSEVGRRKWEKDSLVLSDSRSNAIAVLPNIANAEGRSVHKLLLRLSFALLGILSRNIPEDLEGFIDGAVKALAPGDLEKVTRYVLNRNLNVSNEYREAVLRFIGGIPYEVYEVRKRSLPLAIELYVNALRVLRGYL
ncbi:MAG: type III-B CRISPR-associated protein Cas10/Cmr2 [Zestosphaera sp.]